MSTWTPIGAPGASWRTYCFCVFDGALYAGVYGGATSVGKYSGGAWTDVSGAVSGSIVACLAVHNGKLYAGAGASGTLLGHVWQYDGGTTWTDCGRPGGTENGAGPLALCSFGGALYAALNGNNSAAHAHVMRWDGGTTWTDVGTPDTGGYHAAVSSLAVFDGALYAATDQHDDIGKVKRYDGGTTWTDTGLLAADGVLCLGVFDGHLWAGTDDMERHVWRYDGGTDWTDCGEVEDDEDARVRALVEYDSLLHAGASGYPEHNQVASFAGGTTWTTLPAILDEWINVLALCVFDGALYAGVYQSGIVYCYYGELPLAVSPQIVDQHGGAELTLTGAFDKGTTYAVHMGPLGTTEDPRCYGGPGNGYYSYSLDGATMIAVAPPVANDSLGAQYVSIDGFLAAPITVVESPFKGVVLNSRRCHPPWAGVGARRLELEARRALAGAPLPLVRSANDEITVTDQVVRAASQRRNLVDTIAAIDDAVVESDTYLRVSSDTIAMGADAAEGLITVGREALDSIVMAEDETQRAVDGARVAEDTVVMGEDVVSAGFDQIRTADDAVAVGEDAVSSGLDATRSVSDDPLVLTDDVSVEKT